MTVVSCLCLTTFDLAGSNFVFGLSLRCTSLRGRVESCGGAETGPKNENDNLRMFSEYGFSDLAIWISTGSLLGRVPDLQTCAI